MYLCHCLFSPASSIEPTAMAHTAEAAAVHPAHNPSANLCCIDLSCLPTNSPEHQSSVTHMHPTTQIPAHHHKSSQDQHKPLVPQVSADKAAGIATDSVTLLAPIVCQSSLHKIWLEPWLRFAQNPKTLVLQVSAEEAARIARTDGVNRLLASRKLVLVLDLDHTLLNTVRDIDLVGEERLRAQQQLQQQHAVLQRQQYQQDPAAADGSGGLQEDSAAAAAGEEPADAADAAAAAADAAPTAAAADFAPNASTSSSSGCTSYSGNPWEPQPQQQQQQQQQQLRQRLFHLADKGLWTKLRPGVESFLAHVSQLYELHIYTMGDKGYAGLMADLLDPEHKLFVGRVISAVSMPQNFECRCGTRPK
jgi:hypothetical protein